MARWCSITWQFCSGCYCSTVTAISRRLNSCTRGSKRPRARPLMDLLERIDAWRGLVPERVAHRSPDGRLTYAELARGSDAGAARIAGSVPDGQSPVGIVSHNEPEMLLRFLRCVKAGHPYAPLD